MIFFSPKGNIKKQEISDVCVRYENIMAEDEVIIFFDREVIPSYPPYNVYYPNNDNGIIEREFEYSQKIVVPIDKSSAAKDMFKRVIDFFIFLKSKIECDMLVASELHNEICLLKDEKMKWTKSFNY